MKIKTCSFKPLKKKGIRKQDKLLILLSNQQVIIGPEWWAMKQATKLGKPISEVRPTKVRVNRIITVLSKLLEQLEHENHK